MDSLFQGSKSVVVYIDDILLTGRSQEEHLANLNKVLGKLEEVGLKCNKDKMLLHGTSGGVLGLCHRQRWAAPNSN